MNNTEDRSNASKRRIYIVEFTPVCIWATEEENHRKLVCDLLDDDSPEFAESFTLEDIGSDEDSVPYSLLNNPDGTPDYHVSNPYGELLAACKDFLRNYKDAMDDAKGVGKEHFGFARLEDSSNRLEQLIARTDRWRA